MPIKFRCIHCGQYLGISRSKAGTIVDCPTCGRSMGVPLKDGQAERVGRPSLNHEDSQLAEALREVAAIAHGSDSAMPQLPPHFDRGSDARETREVHVPPPTVIPAKPLPPAERLDPSSKPTSPQADTPDEADLHGDTEETLVSQVPLEHLAALAEMEPPEEPASPAPLAEDNPFPRTNVVPWKLWLAFITVGFSALIAGFLLGRWDKPNEPSVNAETVETLSPAPALAKSPSVDAVALLGQVAVRGKVEYSQGQGSAIRPDAGAWGFAFPVPNETGIKIPAEWFASDKAKLAPALQALGGNAVQADEDGNLQLPLLHPGKYLVLICSQNKTSGSAQEPPEVLSQYLENPQELLGSRAFQSKELDYQGEAQDLALEVF